MFVVDGKLVSIEMEDVASSHEETADLAQEIEANPELKASLQRYIDHPKIKHYTVDQLKELRNERRRSSHI